MKEIKTRDRATPTQSENHPLINAALMKQAAEKARHEAEKLQNADYESAEAYAYDEAQNTVEEATAAVADHAKANAQRIHRKVKEARSLRQAKPSAPLPEAGTNASPMPMAAEQPTSAIRQRQVGVIKTREAQRQAYEQSCSAIRTAQKSVKMAERSETMARNVRYSSRTAIKTVDNARRATAGSIKAANDSRKAAKFAKQTAIQAKKAAKAAAKVLKAAIKGAIKAVKALVSAIAAGGWVAVLIILIICMLGMIVASAYGIFAGNDVSKATDGNTSRDLRSAIITINSEYYNRIQNMRNGVDNLEDTTIYINGEVGAMAGVWQDVLAVYAVDTSHGDNATLAIDFDASKTQRLREIFWSMVTISHKIIERPVQEEQEIIDANGNVTTESVEVIYRDLYVYVKTKSAAQAAALYAFTGEQNKVLAELMSDSFTKAWSDLIYGYSYGDESIVAVAISQIGNIGGEPYWRWYGLSTRTEWCAIFVSWCAEQCGYIADGVIPKFAWVPDGISWFQARGQWQPGGYTPAPGDIIFFDWEGDGGGNHVGIVECVENGMVHTVEGNSGDTCRRKSYSVGDRRIMGYGLVM